MCFEVVRKELGRYSQRLDTFKHWTGVQSPESLARSGFFYIQKYNFVKCFYCQIEIGKWQPTDVAIIEHLKWSPSCLYANIMELIPNSSDHCCNVTVKLSPNSNLNYFQLFFVAIAFVLFFSSQL